MASVASSPNFAVVCSFLERYAALLRLPDFNFAELEAALDDTDEAPNALVELHLRLLKTMGQKVARDRWEKHLAKMCEDFDSPLAWELKNLGYPKMSQANKLILLKFLCETQFDDNVRFKATVNEEEAELMRVQPLGRDRHGLVYWIHTDGHFNTRLYTEEQDDLEQSSWKLLSRNREGLAEVLQGLKLAVSGGAAGQEQNSPSCSSSDTEEPTKLPPPYTTAFKLGQKMKENKAEMGDSGGKNLEEEEGEEEEEVVAPSKKERSEVGETKGGGASGSPEEAEDEEDSSLMKEAVIKLERLDDTMLEKLSQDTCKEETQAKLPVKKRELRMPTEISSDARPSKSDVDGEAQASGADAGGEGRGVASEGGGGGSGGAQGTAEGEAENGQNGEFGRNGGGSGGGGSGGDDVSKGGSVAHKSDAEKDGEDTAVAPTTRKRGTLAAHADRVKDAEKGDSEAVAGDPSKVNGQGGPRRITRQQKAASEEAKKAEEKSSSEEKGSSGESEGNDDGGEESQEEPSEGANIDDSCKRCGLSSHPELILLCDGCDDGYHTACLRPPLMLIPDGDWFCPSCQHKKLCEKMEEELSHLDRMVKKSNRAQRRKEMLTYVGISSENILPRKASFNSVQDDENEEPVGRQRLERRSSRARKAVSYEYKEFDDAIITAIEEDIKEVKEAKRRMAMEQEAEDSGKEEDEEGGTGRASAAAAGTAAPASGPVHRGKDISTILRASGRHSGESDDGATAIAEKPKKRAADKSSDDDKDEESDEDDGRRGMARGRGRKRAPAKRKARRLTALDSFDEESEDEDYQESGTEVEEPDNWVDEYGSGDASSGSDYWQSLSRRPRKPRTEPTRRSQRLRGRPMEEDSDLESSDSEVARAARRAGRNKRSERRTAPARRGTRGNRAMARRKGGRNDSDASESDASHKSSPVVARRARATATPRKRQTRSSESHESASSASERPVQKRRRAAPASRARSSDEEEEEDEEKAGQRAKPAGSRQRRASGAGGSAQRRQKRPSSARAPVRTPKRKRAARSGRTTTGGAGAGSSSEEHEEHKEGSGGGGESGEDVDEAAIAAGKAQRARDARPRRPRRAAAARGTKAAAAAACDSSGEDEGAPPPPARASRRAGATKEGGGGGDDDEDVADDLLGVEDLVDYVTGE